MTLYTLVFATLGFLSPEHRGNLLIIMVFLFVFMGVFSGYYSARFYKMFGVRFMFTFREESGLRIHY
jgi:transmembrane 9 superfamily protein 2/4